MERRFLTHDPEETRSGFAAIEGMVADGLVGAFGGLVGTALMTVVLLVGASVGGFNVSTFASLADLVGLGGFLSDGQLLAVGYFIFLGGGMTTWPLLFASIARYLPGSTFAKRGIPYGIILWTGFVLAFYDGYTGVALGVYVVCTLVGHVAYGFGLGSVFDFLTKEPENLV